MKEIHSTALFRYSVLGPLVSRGSLQRGELKATLQTLAARDYDIPGSANTRLGEKTIEGWYYAWRRGGIEALVPKPRSDRGQSKLAPEVQEAILAAKRANPRRSIRGIHRLDNCSCVVLDCWFQTQSTSPIHGSWLLHPCSRFGKQRHGGQGCAVALGHPPFAPGPWPVAHRRLGQ